MFCEAIEQLQRDALDKPRPELVVKVDRSGLTSTTRSSRGCIRRSTGCCKPIVAAEERRAGAHLIGAPRAVTARDQVGLRALNDLLKAAFDQPGTAAAEPGDEPSGQAARQPAERASRAPSPQQPSERAPRSRRPRRPGVVVQAVAGAASPRREAHGHAAGRPDPVRPAPRWRSRPTQA